MSHKFRRTITLTSLILMGCTSTYAGDTNNQKVLNKIKGHLSNSYTVDRARSIADKITDQDLLYKVALAFAKSGNPSNSVWYASKLTDDPERQYEIAKVVIIRGNPSNGRQLLQRMPNEYKLRGVELLFATGNPKNAEYLKGTIK